MFLRQVAVADRTEWLRMRMALWPDHTDEEHLAEMKQVTADEVMATFVADRGDGKLGGFLEVALRKYADGCETSPVGYIEGWYVDEDLRQRGVGGLLVKAAEQWAIEHGCTEMASDCLIDNEVSYRAHLALGYAEVERLIHFQKGLVGF